MNIGYDSGPVREDLNTDSDIPTRSQNIGFIAK